MSVSAFLSSVRNIQNAYSKNIGRPAFNALTASKFGPEVAGGLVGGAYGFSTEDLGATAMDPEQENNIGQRFTRALTGFLMGASGMLAIRNKNISILYTCSHDVQCLTSFLPIPKTLPGT